MTKTRKVDEFGNVRYDVTVGGKLIGQIHKTCSAWQVEPAPFTSYAPIASVTKGMEWLALYARVMAKSAAHFDGREDDMTTTGTARPGRRGAGHRSLLRRGSRSPGNRDEPPNHLRAT